ncbi:hypothetical protein DPMN_056350 [Dreissena polymorpha]|uniref:Uncharacterized protein n=1 Tax=Dreissena polymorpha TaxID=45954 RepID=A0A9D4CT31_DREPO|nr:hypothetical protein DPMN_056350 [Dreissena polymorpha]
MEQRARTISIVTPADAPLDTLACSAKTTSMSASGPIRVRTVARARIQTDRTRALVILASQDPCVL